MSDLEKVVQWALKMGFSTGHASTLEDLLDEIEFNITEMAEDWRLEMKELRETNEDL